MSLITITEKLRTGRRAARTLLILLTVAGAVILGLLAMHSLNSHTGTHLEHQVTLEHADTTPAAVVGAASADHDAAPGECTDCATGGSDAMFAMACVLALLVTLLTLIRPAGVGVGVIALPLRQPPSTPVTRSVSQPPSLTVLCISRT